jgi:hypothetical protein
MLRLLSHLLRGAQEGLLRSPEGKVQAPAAALPVLLRLLPLPGAVRRSVPGPVLCRSLLRLLPDLLRGAQEGLLRSPEGKVQAQEARALLLL